MSELTKMPEMEEMRNAFDKLAECTDEFLKKYGNPHTTIIADQSGIEMVQGLSLIHI